MSADFIALSDYLLAVPDPERRIAYHQGRYIHHDEFRASVYHWLNRLKEQPDNAYALFTENAYPFVVFLFALLHAGKQVWIPGNNRPGTAEKLKQSGCTLIGDWHEAQSFLAETDGSDFNWQALSPSDAQIIIFTSGSTGEPKTIKKYLQQLQSEVNNLEKLWGQALGNSEILATVSHQHIYGLLFRVLWPLSAGRCIHSAIYLNPEILVKHASKKACWIASPAQLKRLAEASPWQELARLTAIFSSGGALPDAARQLVAQHSKQNVIEIYGSSETGGIGWREEEGLWTLFPGMSLSEKEGDWLLTSPYLPDTLHHKLDDRLTLLEENRFRLLGRADRIVKVEEKRVSLTEIENRLKMLTWVKEAIALVISKHRDVIAVVIALNQEDFQQLTENRQRLIKNLRKTLQPWFEAVVLPRKWLFVNEIPLTAQGKIDLLLLAGLLNYDERKLPQPLSLGVTESGVKLELKVSPNLVYFPDHFAGYPILPGVVQLAWAEYFAKLFFDAAYFRERFSNMDTIKFIKVIHPGDELTLTLNWRAEAKELQFNFSADLIPYSSGRMAYKAASFTAIQH